MCLFGVLGSLSLFLFSWLSRVPPWLFSFEVFGFGPSLVTAVLLRTAPSHRFQAWAQYSMTTTRRFLFPLLFQTRYSPSPCHNILLAIAVLTSFFRPTLPQAPSAEACEALTWIHQ